LIFVLMVLFVPGGLSDVISNLWQKLFGKKDGKNKKFTTPEEIKS